MTGKANELRLSWRLFGREMRSGELRLLFLALTLAVAAVTAVGFFTDRVRQALESEAVQLLGADLLLVADHPWSEGIAAEARRRGLRDAETRVFPSMVLADGKAHLADIKAVSSAYPLRGQLRIATTGGDTPASGGPRPGEAWVDERLGAALALRVGDIVQLGRVTLTVAAILTFEPDRGVNFFSVAPRLMMALDDLQKTGLIQPGSRITYRLLVAGEAGSVTAFHDWLKPRLGRGERIEDVQNARPEIRGALERAQRFLGLATLLTVVLAAVATALAARRYLQRHLDACAVMRCFGATQASLMRLHVALFGCLAGMAALTGCLTGYLMHFLLYGWLADLLATSLPQPTLLAAGQGLVAAAVLLFGFALPPLQRLSRVPTLRVLRRELGPASAGVIGGHVLGIGLLAALMLWVAGDLRLGAYAVLGFVAAGVVFTLLARGAVRLAGGVRGSGFFGWRQGLANLERHGWASTVQIVALALGLLAMLLLTATRGELLAAWQKASPPDAPNKFIINILEEQVKPLRDEFAKIGLAIDPAPMVRARLISIGGRAVGAADYPDDERAQRLVEREFNLSWRADLPAGNRVTAGRWFEPDDTRGASVEEGLAKTLGIRVGDELVFTIQGEDVGLRVVGLRKLDWDSMRVNFFVLTPPGVIDRFPASRILSVHLPPGHQELADRLVARFPNLTIIDVTAIVNQLQSVMARVASAVQFIFVFTLLAGVIVLYAALMSAFDERRHELAVMRALGARRAQLRSALLTELAAIGALAGVIAGTGALGIGQLLARKVFQLDMLPNFWLIPAGLAAGALLSATLGWWGMRSLLNTPPALVLREGA